jgi:hypothetical protein
VLELKRSIGDAAQSIDPLEKLLTR